MKDSINVKWLGDMSFEADVEKHKIRLDTSEESGGNSTGPKPKPLMMVSLAGCTGMDVVSLLKKMKVDFKAFDVKVEGELTEEHPKHYTSMHLVYEVKGDHLPIDKINRAIELSLDRYCGVAATLRKALNLTYEIILL